MFGVQRYLNVRQQDVNTFETLFTAAPRTDTPDRVPRPPSDDFVLAAARGRVLQDPDAETLSDAWRRDPAVLAEMDRDDLNDLSDFQRELLALVYSLDERPVRGTLSRLAAPILARRPRSEADAATEAQVRVEAFLRGAPVPRRPPPPAAGGAGAEGERIRITT
jgi:hypothetical protein